eukprot:TRINITY_DN27795_c0_g2_i1.p1 TRINITY_DN27795_c0_g2~~TRINITY_DN27795_c0_g2_i1.p1  ORF type:complete len:546 (-),score=114.75 TRINITY_DN27795_c0_g2_i1:110-1660(-)
MATGKTISAAELASHNKPGDLWMAINGHVYDVSKFAKMHPGGPKILEQYAGKDVTEDFYEFHRHTVLDKYERLRVGQLEGSKEVDVADHSKVPFADLPAFQGQHSPYFNESHRRFADAVRSFVRTELEPIAAAKDLAGTYADRKLQEKMGSKGLLLTGMGPGPWMFKAKELGIEIPGGVSPEEFDYFHEMLRHQEIARLGLPGFIDGIGAGWLISAPAVYHFGTDEMRKTVSQELLRGEKWSALAITEPFAGSDVAGIRATATKTPDGKHYVVNGIKKWITEGAYADYFVTPVRTGGSGAKGISLLLIERSEGVETSQMKTTYSSCAGTALVQLNDVMVPVSNLMGKENEGFKLVMYNFNHERWMICQNLLGQVRAALTDTFLWARQRKIFGKQLIDQPVIRNKLAQAVSALESVQSYNEAVTYDMCKTKDGPVNQRLGGPIAMLKYQTTRTAWNVADNCVQILGGRGITRTGMGAKVEGLKNFAKYAAVYGGSEEIMADLSIKQAMKNFPPNAKL